MICDRHVSYPSHDDVNTQTLAAMFVPKRSLLAPQCPEAPHAHKNPVTAVDGSHIYLCGGVSEELPSGTGRSVCDAFWRFDTITKVWTKLANFPGAFSKDPKDPPPELVNLKDGRLLLFIDDAHLYNISNDTWSTTLLSRRTTSDDRPHKWHKWQTHPLNYIQGNDSRREVSYERPLVHDNNLYILCGLRVSYAWHSWHCRLFCLKIENIQANCYLEDTMQLLWEMPSSMLCMDTRQLLSVAYVGDDNRLWFCGPNSHLVFDVSDEPDTAGSSVGGDTHAANAVNAVKTR